MKAKAEGSYVKNINVFYGKTLWKYYCFMLLQHVMALMLETKNIVRFLLVIFSTSN